MLIPINKKLNSERMLETGEFQTEHFHNDEMLWLVTYLRKTKKMCEDDVYNTWLPFYLKKDTATLDFARRRFKLFWMCSKSIIIKNEEIKIVLSKDEIAYVNSLPIPKFVKEYLLILLLHTRATQNNIYDSIPFKSYHWYISSTDHNYEAMTASLLKYAKKYNFVKEIEIEEHYDMLEVCDDYGNPCGVEFDVTIKNTRLEIASPVESCEKGFVYTNILDALDNLNKIVKSTSICSECGSEYEFNSRSKKDICDECWKKKERERKRLVAQRLRNTTK